jgi:glycosyltransferase involved in cell wall biosynthesis
VTDDDIGVHARNQKSQRAPVLPIVNAAALKTEDAPDAFEAARRKIQVNSFDRLITVDDFDPAVFDDSAQLRRQIEIDRKFASELDELRTRLAKISFERAALSGDERHVETEIAGVPADIEHLRFGSAAVRRVQKMKYVHALRVPSDSSLKRKTAKLKGVSEVTVLVPSYNHAPFVERTLRSIFAQTLAPKKLIVIDDGSKDESVMVIKRVLAGCPFESQFITRENRGLCSTLNEGFAHVDTDFFAYISSDDTWRPGFLERRARLLTSRRDAVLAYGYSDLIDEFDAVTDSTRNWAEYADGDVLEMLLFPIIPASASVLYRTSFLNECRWNETSKLEDYELYLRLAVRGDFALDPGSPLSAWRIHGYNTSNDFALMMDEWIEAQRRTIDETGLSEEKLAEVQTRLKFRCVKDFLRRGDRETAWKLFAENRAGAPLIESVSTALRFLVPAAVWARRNGSKLK